MKTKMKTGSGTYRSITKDQTFLSAQSQKERRKRVGLKNYPQKIIAEDFPKFAQT